MRCTSCVRRNCTRARFGANGAPPCGKVCQRQRAGNETSILRGMPSHGCRCHAGNKKLYRQQAQVPIIATKQLGCGVLFFFFFSFLFFYFIFSNTLLLLPDGGLCGEALFERRNHISRPIAEVLFPSVLAQLNLVFQHPSAECWLGFEGAVRSRPDHPQSLFDSENWKKTIASFPPKPEDWKGRHFRLLLYVLVLC